MADRKVTPHNKMKPGRNSRTPANINATYCESYRSSSSSKSRIGSTAKGRHNLDSTTLNTTMQPKMKTAFSSASSIDMDLEVDFAYNDYLQALFKQQIINKKVQQHKVDLEDQIAFHLKDIYTMDKKYIEMKNEIDKVQNLNEINELIKTARVLLGEFESLEGQLNLKSSIEILIHFLEKHCDEIVFKNCQPIETEMDYKKLVDLLNKCSEYMEKMLASTNYSEEINQLAQSIKTFNEVKQRMMSKRDFTTIQTEKLIYKLLEDTSDYFAAQNGY